MTDLLIKDALVFLVAAGLIIPVIKRLNISPILGFLTVGLAIGPYGFARLEDLLPWLTFVSIADVEGAQVLAELGVIFLLFMIGIELSLARLWSMRKHVLGMGNAQILLTAVVIGVIAWTFDNSVEAAVLLGSCLALSSTAVVMQILIERGRFGSTVGQGTFAVLLAQDIAVVPILFMTGALAAQGSESVGVDLAIALASAAVAVGIILGVGHLAVRPLFRFVGALKSPELFMAVTLLLIIATATSTHAAGLSAALGAFLAGLLLAESEYRHEIEINIEPFKGLLLGLFFVSVGMSIDLAKIASDPLWIIASIIGLIAIKACIGAAVFRLFGFSWGNAGEMGLLLAQGGEFAFVVVGMAMSLGLLPAATAQFMLIVVGATMFLTPATATLAHALGNRIRAGGDDAESEDLDIAQGLTNHVIIVGYGRTGALLADLLDDQQIPYVAIDLDANLVATLRQQGVAIHAGDASRSAMLERLHVDRAQTLAICTDDPGATEKVLHTARRVAPEIPIVARARDNEHAAELMRRGATRVVPELLESGLQLGHVMMEEAGLPSSATRDLIEAKRVEQEYVLDAMVYRNAEPRPRDG